MLSEKMFINWLGQGCIKIQSRDVILITDPLNKQSGLKPPRLSNINIITFSSSSEDNRQKLNTEALIIDGPGEYEIKQIFIQGIPLSQNQGKETITVYWMEIEGMTLGHLGTLGNLLTDEQLENLEGLDIIFIPVGGHKVLDAKKASQVISQIEPRIVIPIYYRIPNLREKLDTIDPFCKEMGIESSEKVERLRIQKKDLPQEETKIIILQNQ